MILKMSKNRKKKHKISGMAIKKKGNSILKCIKEKA